LLARFKQVLNAFTPPVQNAISKMISTTVVDTRFLKTPLSKRFLKHFKMLLKRSVGTLFKTLSGNAF